MTNLVSVITPVHAPAAIYLPAAHESLATQALPDGWDWEWLIQEDGETGVIEDLLPMRDSRIRIGIGQKGGPAVARNLALARARGSLVKVLDADDMLCPGALGRDIGILSSYPDVAWTSSRAIDLLPDGSTTGFEHDPPEGKLIGTAIFHHWREHQHRAPVHPATLCARRDLLLALGGWMALPSSEDTGLLLSLSVLADGYFCAEAGLYYRKWPGQSTNQVVHTQPEQRAARMRLIEARIEALLSLASPMLPSGSTLVVESGIGR